MQTVAVVDATRRPLTPVHPARARKLLTRGHAAVWRRVPFALILKHAVPEATSAPLRLKIDPGSRTSGLAVLDDASGLVLFAAELTHRGLSIKAALDQRRTVRHSRRHRHCRYRAPRFRNRHRPAGWLPPSLASRVANLTTWVARLRRVYPIGAMSMELVRFDTQKPQNAELRGTEYQQGELAGYEVRQYLLEKWRRRCAYCGATGVPLEVEHIVPRSRGGTDRVSNLTLACPPCNARKSSQTAAEFGYPQIQARAKLPLRDAAAVNSTRWALYRQLLASGLPVEAASGGRPQYNRVQRGLPKTHWLDAACVGASTPTALDIAGVPVWQIQATGHGNRQMCHPDRYGFPHAHRARRKVYFGFRTGDRGRAVLPQGKYAEVQVGRITVRASGQFRVGAADGIGYRRIHRLWRADGYAYQPLTKEVLSPG